MTAELMDLADKWDRQAAGNGSDRANALSRCADDLRALASRAGGWLPIESAPKDHLPRLYLCRGRVVQGFVDVTDTLMVQHELGWRRMRRNPSHWRPLPTLPGKAIAALDSEESK